MSVRPRLALDSLTIGTPDPDRAVRFWAELLGWRITKLDPAVPGDPELGGWAQLEPPVGESGPMLYFEHERYYARPVWPSEPGRQTASQHLDVRVDDLEASTAWAIDHGAELARVQPHKEVRVLVDPDGHPFCLYLGGESS